METLKSMKQTKFPVPDYETWKLEVEKSLKGKSFEKLLTNTYENIVLKPLYTKEDLIDINMSDDLPGFSSYVRGTNPLGYRKNPWKVAQQLDVVEPNKVNQTLKRELDRGLSMIHLLLNDETNGQEQSTRGVVFRTIEDIQEAFKTINLENTPLYIDGEACSLPVFTQFIAALKDTTDLTKLTGTIGMDPLGSIVKHGNLSVSLDTLFDIMAAIVSWADSHTPNLRTILVKADPYEQGGANAVQQIAYAIATGVEYLNESLNRGLSVNQVANKITFSFPIGANMFMEIAKLRAAKMLWAKVVKEYDGNLESQKMHIHANTSSFTKTVYDPYVNMLRGTTEAFSAIIGGIDSLSVTPFDEAISHSTDFSRRIARNIQIILKDEVNLDKVIDPAGGSWYVESLTNEVAKEAWALFQQIESLGGMAQALKSGFIQKNVQEVYEKRVEKIHSRKDKMVGTNYYANLKEQPLANRNTETQAVIVHNHKSNVSLLNKENLVESAIQTSLNGATIQELIEEIKQGEQGISIESIISHRLTESFEHLRVASENYREHHGHFPKVGLINLGQVSKHKARADFITGFFEAGGFEVVKSDGAFTVEEAVNMSVQQHVNVFIICGADDQYLDMVPGIAAQLHGKKVFVAGSQPKEVEEQFTQAGVNGFIHVKSNCYTVLSELQQEMGVTE